MKKNILELNIPEENKILLSKIDNKVTFLSEKADEYFANTLSIKSDKIEEAYSVNENLISILRENDELVESLRRESFNIREIHQTDFTREIKLTVTEEVTKASIIKSTIDQKDKLLTADQKLFALQKRRNFISKGGAKRKKEMDNAFNILEESIANERLLNIAPMQEDVQLINKFINPKEINKTRYLYLAFIIPLLIVVIMLGGVFVWTL